MPELVSRPDREWSVVILCKGGCRYGYRYFAADLWVGWFRHPTEDRIRRYYVRCENCEKVHLVSPPDSAKSLATQD